MRNAVFVLFSTCFFLGMLFSQTKTLTLSAAVDLALEKNIDVIRSQNAVESADSKVLAAYGSYLPTVSASGGWTRNQTDQQAGVRNVSGQNVTFPSSFSVSNTFSAGASLNYTLFNGFARESSFKSAKAGAVSTQEQQKRTRQTIRNSVENSYLDILRNEQLVKVVDENLKRDQRQLERITESNKVGAVALADVYRQQSQVAADEMNVINAQNTFDQSKADLIALIGLDPGVDYKIADASVSPVIDQTELKSTQQNYQNSQAFYDRALAARSDCLSAKENVNAAEAGVTAARSGYFPSVSTYLQYGLYNDYLTPLGDLSNNKNTSWGIRLNWNVFDAFQTNEALQSAISSKHDADAAMLQAERAIAVALKKAFLNLDAARKQVEVSQMGLTSATEDRKIAEERYNLGSGTLLDLLTANAGLVNAEVNSVDASYFYIMAKRNLEYAIGERTY